MCPSGCLIALPGTHAICWQHLKNSITSAFGSSVFGIDTDGPMGRAMFTIVAAMAGLESSLISDRVIAGLRAEAEAGILDDRQWHRALSATLRRSLHRPTSASAKSRRNSQAR